MIITLPEVKIFLYLADLGQSLRVQGMSKTDQAYEAIKRDILDSVLLPDEPLTVASLQARYGLGWTPLRDALSRLEGENLVTLIRNRGYRVASASNAEVLDVQRARLTVERELLAGSILDGDEEWQKRVLLAHRNLSRVAPLEKGMPEGDYAQWETAHQAFHLALISGTDSPWLYRFALQLYGQIRRYQRLVVLRKSLPADSETNEVHATDLYSRAALVHHTALMEAALDHDITRALELLRNHVELDVQPTLQRSTVAQSQDS